MAKTDNLTDYLTDLADGIRAKKGTTDPINPQDFRKEIESISGGGNGGSAEDDADWLFFERPEDVRSDVRNILGACLVKRRTAVEGFNMLCITDFYNCNLLGDVSQKEIVAVAYNPNAICKYVVDAGEMGKYQGNTMREVMELMQNISGATLTIFNLPKITKEQFYSLE